MFTIFLLGNIASGKSTAARYLERRGALRIDLDQIARDLYVPGSRLVSEVAEAFGWDVLDERGGIRRAVLAARAFATPEDTARLNAIVHPAVLEQLGLRLLPAACCTATKPEHEVAVVEVSAPAGFEEAFGLADAVICVTAPLAERRRRAVARGMDAADFDRRAEVQMSEEELVSRSDLAIDNATADDSLFRALDAFLVEHGLLAGTAPASPSEGGEGEARA